jgi:Ca2+:H+ antiporter
LRDAPAPTPTTDTPKPMASFLRTVPKLALLLALLPVAVALELNHVGGLPLFAVAGLAILGTVSLIGKGTEEAAIYVGPVWGGLLNATFGNVTELIIALFALRAGLFEVVRASITGSILGNLLLVLGGAMLYGGVKYQTQTFSRTGAQINVGMLWVTLFALVVPSLVHAALGAEAEGIPAAVLGATEARLVEQASIVAAIILLVLYVLMLVFSLRTHRFLLRPGDERHEEPDWSKRTAIIVLGLSTVAVAWLSEAFVGAIDGMGDVMSEIFIGVIVVAIVGNAAEGLVAVWVAAEDKMELSFQIAMGSCLQVALLVAPVLVIASLFMDGPMLTLVFNPFELMALTAAVIISSAALNDGESNWLEGAMFLAVYLFFALVFWFHP